MKDNLAINFPPPLPNDPREKVKKEEKRMTVLSIKEVFNKIEEKCETTKVRKFGSGNHYVVILPEAWEELKSMIGWGKRTPTNVYEQLYQGMGHYFRNEDGNYILIVSHFLYIYAAHRSSTSACISNGEYDSMMRRIEYERKIFCANEVSYNRTSTGKIYNPWANWGSEVNIYGHTHPDIGVFFSYDDKGSGYATPAKPAAIFVADPIRKLLKAGVGVKQEDAQIVVFEYVTKDMGIGGSKKTNVEFETVRRKSSYSETLMRQSEKVTSDEVKNNVEDIDMLNNDRIKILSRDELIIELGRICNELLNPIHNSKGVYSTKTTMRGKERIKVDIKIASKTVEKRNSTALFTSSNDGISESGDAYV